MSVRIAALFRPHAIALFLAFCAVPATAQTEARDDGPLAGAFLAGRVAQADNDFAAQATYYQRALRADPDNPLFMDAAMLALLALGRIDEAAPLAQALLDRELESQVAGLVVQADAFAQGDYTAVLDAGIAAADAPPGVAAGTGPLTDALAPPWAQIGAGRMSDALAAFDALIDEGQFVPFALYQKALALALVGDFEGAEAILAGDDSGPINMGRRAVLARLLVLGQLERFDIALDLIDENFGTEPDSADIAALRDAFGAGEAPPFDMITSAAEGMGEVYSVIASVLVGDEGATLPLFYARLARHLNPRNSDAQMLAAQMLESLEQYTLADEAYGAIAEDDPAFLSAQLGRAQALSRAGDPDTAIARLQEIAADHPEALSVHSTLGDLLRREERFDEAVTAYERAIDLVETPEQRHWVLFYTYAISLERAGRFEEAEPWFRRTLEFVPDNPSVLNYLGYSLIEERRNLDEALDMIERAVEGDPNSGYITDSLGWAFYRLGRYDEAVPVMERAVELLPNDPIINDHLGDVYWMVGREREARFQWRRALSFAPHADLDLDRVRRKLEVGLDVVLAEEEAGADSREDADADANAGNGG